MFSNPRVLRCVYVFCKFFFEPTNVKSIFFGIWLENRAFILNIYLSIGHSPRHKAGFISGDPDGGWDRLNKSLGWVRWFPSGTAMVKRSRRDDLCNSSNWWATSTSPLIEPSSVSLFWGKQRQGLYTHWLLWRSLPDSPHSIFLLLMQAEAPQLAMQTSLAMSCLAQWGDRTWLHFHSLCFLSPLSMWREFRLSWVSS